MTEPAVVRVVLVDDHPLVRLSLKVALSTAPDIEVVGDAADGEEALRMCQTLHPEVVLLDLRLPGLDSSATIHALLRQVPSPQVLALTASYNEQLIGEALAAGARAYLLKQGNIDEILTAIRAAHATEQAKA
ncbi:MAG TPA: response regulator transcription factor [Ktedonobacterales bacterium]|nr:response regulator transcription factor [Ktedonobacterales bacterium]